jgi:hypothetical protein
MLTNCSFTSYKYTSGDNKNTDSKCYARCMMPERYETISNEYVIYTSDESVEDVEVEHKVLELAPATTEWVKKKAERNCLSADPDDCLVWCLVNSPAVTREITVLLDTTQSRNFIIESIGKRGTFKTGGGTEIREVLCDDDVTNEIITQIQETLRDNGYWKGDITGKLDDKTKEALNRFQIINSLPQDQLDIETLEALGILF